MEAPCITSRKSRGLSVSPCRAPRCTCRKSVDHDSHVIWVNRRPQSFKSKTYPSRDPEGFEGPLDAGVGDAAEGVLQIHQDHEAPFLGLFLRRRKWHPGRGHARKHPKCFG